MKQVEENPWERVAEKYPPGSVVKGKVRNIANYGAFVEIEEGIDGLLHVSDLSWTKKIGHPREVLKKGEDVQAVVLSVDQEKQRIALGLKQMQEDPWHDASSRPTTARAWSSRATSRRSPTSACSWNWSRASKACCTSREISDQKVEKPEDVRQGRPGSGRQDPARRQRRAEDRPVAQARPVGPGRGDARGRSPPNAPRQARPPRRPGRRRTIQRPGRSQDRRVTTLSQPPKVPIDPQGRDCFSRGLVVAPMNLRGISPFIHVTFRIFCRQ